MPVVHVSCFLHGAVCGNVISGGKGDVVFSGCGRSPERYVPSRCHLHFFSGDEAAFRFLYGSVFFHRGLTGGEDAAFFVLEPQFVAAAFFSRGEGDVSSCGHADAPVFTFRIGGFCRDVTACPDLYISFPNKDCPFVFYGTVFQVVVAVCNALGIVVCMHGTYADVTAGGQQGSAFFAQLFQFRAGEGQVIFGRQEEQAFFVFDGDACCFAMPIR